MISMNEFCALTGLPPSRFKSYRGKFRNLPGEGRFPVEVYEYHQTVIFDTEELCDWWIDWYEEFTSHLTARLGEAVVTLQKYFKTDDLDSVEDLGLRVNSGLVQRGMRGTLQDAYKDYKNQPDVIQQAQEILAATLNLKKERAEQ